MTKYVDITAITTYPRSKPFPDKKLSTLEMKASYFIFIKKLNV